MKERSRRGIVRALTWSLGGLVLGCQTPEVQPPANLPHKQLSKKSAQPPVSRPRVSKTASAPKPEKKTVLEGIRPADSLSACRPLNGQTISVTRFLQDPAPAQTDNRTAEEPENIFQIPERIPGTDAAPLTIPERDPEVPFETYRKQVRDAYKDLPDLPELPFSPADVSTERISLAELQEIAYANSPVLPAAAARVEQARGEAIQVGLYPNPVAGYQSDTVGTSATAGYHGVFATQEIVTADKLKIARSVEIQNVAKAELELRQAEIDLATSVRRSYFDALIAQERLKLARGLAELFKRTYEAHINRVAGGESAPYEPLQLRVFVLEAQNALIQAGNEYVASWRALTAVLNAPNLSPRLLAGSPEMPLPDISYEAALELLLARHTDLSIAQTNINRSELNLWLQQVTPIPNVHLNGVVQYDDTTPLSHVSYNLQVGLPLPIFNKNQGNIYEAQSEILENHQNLVNARNTLVAELAEIYGRYSANRVLAQNYRNEILPDYVRVYRGINQQFRVGADPPDFTQIIVTQQQLGQIIGNYLDVLEAEWRAVVDLAEVLQADDLFSLDQSRPGSRPDFCDPSSLLVPVPAQPREEPKPEAPNNQ